MEQKPDIRERKLEKSRLIGAMRSALQKIVREGFPEAASPQSTRAPADPPALDAQVARDSSPDTGLKSLTAEFNPSKAPGLQIPLHSTCS